MNDGMLLQINRQRNLIPEELLRAAQVVQEQERADGKTPRPLLDILATRGDLASSTVTLIRRLMDKGNSDGNGGEATIVDGFHAIVESRILPPPEAAKGASRAGWPKEVVDAAADVKNLFGQFVLVAQVGSGGSGTVYRAWDRRVSRYSGLKILHTMEPSALERFTREARIAGNLQHPSIATIYEVGEHEGRYYIAMKYIDGKPIDADPRSIPECLGLVRDACRALDYAHKQGIIHRDIKPANLLVDSQDRVYVTDFGIAKQAAHEHTSTLSITGTIIGTPKYLPPEQARGEAKRADARSDVYSIGATLYTLLAGRAPFPSSNVWETLESVMKREPPPLTSLNSAVSPELEQIIAKAMAKDPANRYASAGLLADELDRILEQRRYTGRYGLLRYLARKWVVAAGLGLLIGLLLHWKAGVFFPVKEVTTKPLDPDVTYRIAVENFLQVWKSASLNQSKGDPADPTQDIRKAVQLVAPVDEIARKNPAYLPGHVLVMRANFLADRKQALARLEELRDRADQDYRIGFLEGLVALDKYLATTTPPLPAPEAPSNRDYWDGDVPPGPKDLEEKFQVPDVSNVTSVLMSEQAVDKPAGLALACFAKGDWAMAYSAFEKIKPVPSVYWRAYHRATYLSRRWKETLEQVVHPHQGCRECFGASLARALEEDNLPALQGLLPLCKGDSSADQLIRPCIARRAVERGLDPAPESLPSTVESEYRGILRVAQLRWKALTADDDVDHYRTAFQELQDPKTWMGKLARIEGLLSLARKLKHRNEGPKDILDEEVKILLNEAWDRAKALPNGSWAVPRVFKAEVYLLRTVNDTEAFQELPVDLGSRTTDFRAHLLWSELHRRGGRWIEAGDAAKRASEISPENPVAAYFQAAALLEKAKIDLNPGPEALNALGLLDAALTKRPGYVDALLARALAYFLIADWAAMSPSHAASCRLSAESDLKQVLAKVPNLAPALALQKHLAHLLHREPKGISK